MSADKKKKIQVQLRPERATVRSSGGEVIETSPSIAVPRQSYREHVTGGAYKAPGMRTLENLAAEHIAKQEEEKRNAQTGPAVSFAGMQDWRPSYMGQQAQPALTQPQIAVPSQNRQAITFGGATGPSFATTTQQGGTARQSGGRTGEPKMPSIGRFGAGNIDLFNRPQYRQPDGSLSTVNSISIGTDDGEVLIPTIGRDAQGRPVQWTDDEAIEQYNKTGQYLGKFNTVEEADRYADQLHRQQEVYYGSDIGKTDPASMQRLMGIRGGIDRSGGVNQTIGNAKGDVEILRGEPKNLTREGQWAARHPYAGTAMYGVANVVGSGEGVFNTAEAALRALATGEKMDPNAMKAAPIAQAYRTGSAEGFRRGLQDGITAPVAKAIGIDSDDGRYSKNEQRMDFLSGVVADRVSSLMNMGIAGGLAARTATLTPAQMATIGTVSGALMGANAANQSLYESSQDEDTTARQALALGITSGIWEALFEAYSTESFLSNATPTSIKDLLVKTAAQFGVEFQEEAATEGANIISDYIIRGDNSEIGKDVAAFKANNPDADPNEVARHALLSALYQVSMAGLGGGLSGAMGGAVMAMNQFYGGTQLRSGVRSGDVSLNDIANTADTSTPEGQRVYELANELARREAEGRRTGAMRYGALNNAIINDLDANWETRLEQAAASANARENAIDRTNRIREALRGDNAQAAWETPEDTGVRDVALPSEMREQAAYDLLETRNADRISWDTEQGFVSLDRESDGSYTFTNERGETVTINSQQAAELIPAEQMLTIYDYEGNTEVQNPELASAPSTESIAPSTESTAPSIADTGINTQADNIGAEIDARRRVNQQNMDRRRQAEMRLTPGAAADQNLTQSGGETAQQSTEAQNPVAISQQNASGDQYVAQTANERLEQAAQQVTQRRTVEKAAQLREVYEARKNNSPNLQSIVNSATMLSPAELERALNMGARDALVNTAAQEEISDGRQEGESLSGQRSDGLLSQRTGKRTGRVSAETEAVRRIWRSGEAPADSGAEVLRFTERRRASEVIPESSEDSFVYIPANKTELMEQGEAEANSFGLNVVSWAGGEAVSDKGNYFRGATVPGSDELYAQADNADFTQDRIIKHEIAENKLSRAEFEQIIEEARSKSEFVNAAIEIYQSLSGEDEYRSAKELVCDSNGKMNQFEKRAQENPDNAEYQVIREILQRAIDTINPIVSEKLETKKVQRAAATKVSRLPGVTPQEKVRDVNNSTEHSVELPYTFGSKAAKAWVEKLDPEAKKYAELFIALHEIGLKNQAEVWITSKGQKKLARRDIAAKNMLVSEWNSYIDSNKEFADAAKKLAEAVPEDIRKNADISPDGRIKPTEFDERLKLMRSFMQRIVDSLPGGLSGNKTLVNGKEVTISRHSKIPSIGGEAYRKALLEERRRQYREGTLGKVAIGGLSGDDWGTMGFLATNTKTIGSGDFTTFCPQMYFGNGGCWYCYRLSALRSGTNNKLVGQNVWYTGEILRLRQQDIDSLNSTGGLRIQSFGDWMEKYTPQLLDLLVDAETVGLQIKIITKEPSMIDAVALLKEQGYGKNLYFNLSADYTIEEQKGPYQPNAARPSMVGGDGVGKEGKTYWKRALSVEEANEYRKKYPWVNIRTVATNIDEFINSLESPYVQVVTGYHGRDFAMKKDENGNMTGGYERISSETGDTLVEVESLGDNGMPVFDYSPEQNKWVRIRDGKNKKQKALADAIEDRGLQFAYYIKACCQTGRCKDCKGNCGAVARDFAVKNATNKDQESIKYWDKIRKTIAEAKGETYKDDFPLLLKMAKAAGAEMKDQDSVAPEKFWQKRMRAITSDEYGETAKYQFPQLLKQSEFDITQKRQEQRQAIFQAGLDGDEDYEDVIAKAYLVPLDERYRILQDGMRAAAGDKGHVEHSVRLPEGLSNYQRRNLEFNKNETTVGNPLKTVAGTTIKRYGWTKKSSDGVGKQLSYSNKKNDEKGSQIYLHKNYAYDVVPQNVYDKALELLKQERPDFKFNTIMYLGTNKRQIVRFDEAPDFDTAREPIPGDMIAVNVTDGTVDTGHSDQIWHHKWLWVKNDYKGFDVKKSWEWSKLWLSVIRDTKNKGELIDGTKVRIDNKGIANGMGENGKWWNEQLRYFGLPLEGENVDYDSRTRADKFVSNLKATQEQRANEPQTDTSEDTSLNQVPASMTNFRFNSDDVVLDWGGGRYDAARRFMESEYPGLKMYVYDPFNRTKAYNNAVLDQMKKQSASVVTINNVLNVINSEKAQRDVVSESKKYLKENGVAIFTIFQGDKSGIGEFTKEKNDNGEEIGTSSWQNNLEAKEYVPMIQDYYEHVKVTGNFIIASDSEEALENVKKANKAVKDGLVSRSKPFIEQKYDMKTAEGFDAIDVEAAADDPNNTNVIRQGSDQDIRYSSKLFDKDVDDRLKASMATLFSGGGTVDFAVRSIVQHEFAVEFKEKIAAVYRANVGGTMYVDDVRTVNINPHKGRVEYLHISPVCTDYSSANNKQGERDIDLKTAEAAARIIDELQPKVVTVENVRRYKNSRAVQIIEEALERNHYLHDKKVYRASDFGGATIRERMFIRAVKDGVLPEVDTSKYTPMTWYDAVKDMIPKLPPAELSNYMRGRLGVSGIDLDNLKQPVFVLGGEKSGELTFATADKPAPTILAKSTEAKILMPDGRILRATPRVMARIQGLPDEFDLGLKNDYDMEESRGNVTNAYRVVGNGVPVQLTQGIVGPLLEENLIKQKSKETGIQYSSKLDSAGSKLTEQQVEYFKNSKIRDKNGNLKRMYHGTRRADRVGTVFRPEMATSGPMAYFTDDESIAQNYSRDKEDTSLKKEGAGDYHRMFRMNIGGKAYTVEDAWDRLPASKRAEIRRKAPHITMDDDYENIIYDKNANKGLGNYDNYLIRDNGGNYIKALVESWLDDGTLYGDEGKFKEVLSLAGLEDVEYLDPEFRDEKVYAVYLNVMNPLVTNDIPQKVINNLRKASETVEWNGPDSNVDSWDKTNVSPQEWFKDFERDIKNGTAYVWTRIPDWVTNVLKDMGYDGISDMGGKKGGVTHNVVIPFSSEQIKNIDNQNPTKDVDIRYSSKLQGDIDKKYDAALRGNDMKTAERLVKEAAEEAGYKLAAYHGTGENFTVFNPGFEGIHLGNREQAEDVAKTRFDQRSKNSNYKWKDIRNRVKEMNREQRESLVSAAYRLGDYYDAPADDFAFDGNIMNDKEVTDYVDREVEGYSKATGENNPRFTMRTFDRETGENVMELYAKINNPLVINGDIVDWEMEHIARLLKAIDHGDDKFLPLFRRDYIDISNAKLKLTSEDKKLLNQAVRTATSDTAVESWNALKEVLSNHGYDGIQYKNEYEGDRQSWSYIALNPSDVKSAEAVTYDDNGNVVPLSERFNPANEDIRYSSKLNSPDYAPTFYSKLQREIQNYKGEKIGAASVESYLKGKGVKDEEIKWSGIRTFLEGKKSVNKQELMQYLKDNEMQIEEKTLRQGGFNLDDDDGYYAAQDALRNDAERAIRLQGLDIDYDDVEVRENGLGTALEAYYTDKSGKRKLLASVNTEGSRWDQYVLNGGDNYREIIFKIPDSDYINDSMRAHWARPGVLAHARVQDFETEDRGKVLFIEEIQSDWHNAGQKEGYRDAEAALKAKDKLDEAKKILKKLSSDAIGIIKEAGYDTPEAMFDSNLHLPERMWTNMKPFIKPKAAEAIEKARKANTDVTQSTRDFYDKEYDGVPDAPFRSTYTDYVLKNLLRMAAEGDYDYLAWTTGKMQEERWSDEFAEGYRIEYDQQIPKFLKKYGKQWGAGLTEVSLPGTGSLSEKHTNDFRELYKLIQDYDYDLAYSQVVDSAGNLESDTEYMMDKSDEGYERAIELARSLDEAYNNGTMYGTIAVPAIVVNDAMKESVLTEGQPMYSRSLTAGMSTQDLDNRINDLVKKYGALPKGEKPARNVDVPMQTSDNKNTRRFVRTILESGITSADLDDSIKSAIINESLSYEVATDKEAAEYAASVIRIGGVERAQREWDKARRSDTFNKDHMALGQFLLKEYAKNNDIDNAMNMIQDLAAEGTRMGQNIQAMRMLKKYAQQVPAIGLGYIQRTVDQMNREAKAKMGKRYKEMKIAPNLAAEYIKAQTRDEIDAALGKIYKNLGSQVQKTVPEEIIDKLRTWRYMSMLGNPRTHIRNLVGNALFVPAVTLKNAIGTGLEGAMNTSTKTKSLTVTKQAMEFAKQDALDMQDVLSGESEKSIRDLIMDQRKVYKFEPLNKASKGNSAALEAEDWVFLRWHYQNALAQYITANHLDTTVQNPAWLGRARRYAVQEAQKATYRDANKVSTWLNQSKGAGAVVKYMMEGLMPFKKTPTNILRRGIEYSPAGLVRTMSKSIYDLNTGKMTVNEWIDALSSGLAGTAIFGIGMFLASTGAILGGYKDDDDKELRKLKGLQEYSVIIGNHTYTIDWAAPGSLPLFIGVETMNALKQERGMTMDDMGKAAARLIDPMINMSMLSGLNDTLDAISYSDDKLSAATMEMFYSLLGQYVPTLFGQVARTIDTTQRINYQDVNTGKPKNMLYFIEKMQNKIPFLTFSNDPYLNEFGQENSGTPHWAAALQNFVSPGYVSEIKDDHVLDEVARLNEAQDKEKVLPRKMQKFIGSGKDRIDLTSSEYHTFQRVAGQTAYNILDAMIDDNRYNSMNANQQATAIKVAYDYAKAVGRIEIQPKYKEDLDGKVKKVYEDVQNGMQAYDSILNRIRTDNISDGIKPDVDENGNAVANSAKYKTIDKILGTSMSKAEQARTFETAFPSEALDRWKASGGDVYDYMMGVKLWQDVSKLSDEKKKKTYEYVVNSKDYTNYQKVAWFVSDKNRTESKNYLAWKDAKGSDWDYIKSRSDLEKFTGLDTKTRRSKVIGYIKRQTTNEAKRKALWQMAGYDLDSTKNKKTVKNGNYNKYFK